MLFMGIDVGTQGVRCAVVREDGSPAAAHSVPFAQWNVAEREGRYEQEPARWVEAVERAVQVCTSQLGCPEEIAAVAVDGTSGTLLALGQDLLPLTRGIMYNDTRARRQAQEAQEALPELQAKLGYRIGASFSLPRMLWLQEEQPEVCARTRLFVHQADYINGLLCGEFVSDDSNALKSGYDAVDACWPREFADRLGLDPGKLPRVVRPGERIARVSAAASARLGLPTTAWVVGGATDGCASALAAGAVAPGRWASILGTTFVLKVGTDRLLIDPGGAAYSHHLPGEAWLLGGAANLGGRVLNDARGEKSFAEMDGASEPLLPTGVRCYPLRGRGERFPFVHPDCEAFYLGDVTGGRLYPAILEGVGFAERLACERMEALGCAPAELLYTAGGACRSPLWLKIRASILQKQLRVPETVDAAVGSALLAASGYFGSLQRAADAMLRYRCTVDPDPGPAMRYEELYQQFRRELHLLYGVEAV